jgi:hypothetical protein
LVSKDLILNGETALGKEPDKTIDIALRKAIAGVQTGFFDLDTGRMDSTAMRGTSEFKKTVRMAGLWSVARSEAASNGACFKGE